MRKYYTIKKIWIASFVLAVSLTVGTNALAQSSQGYTLKSPVFTGGGEDLSSTHYQLRSTVGQPSAIGRASSGQYVNYGGFWYTLGLRPMLFLPLILKQ